MKNKHYTKIAPPGNVLSWCWKTVLSLLLVVASVLPSVSQVTGYTFSQTSGTYTPITGGTVLTSTGLEDDNTYAIALPFSFTFDGVGYTDIYASANGYICFGTTDPGTGTRSAISSTFAAPGFACPYSADLQGGFVGTANRTLGSTTLTSVNKTAGVVDGLIITGTGIPAGTTVVSHTVNTITLSAAATSTGTAGAITSGSGEIRYEDIGSAFVIQWTNFKRFTTSGATNDNNNFQVHLNPSDNSISFVYGDNSSISATSTTRQVGLRGATNAIFNNRTSTTSWAATTAGTLNSSSVSFRNTIFPASGLTFTYMPPNPCLGTPAPGLTLSTVNPVCSGSSFTLSVQNSTPGTGVTYQWQSSPDDASWTDLGTSATQTTSQTTPTYYQCIVNCTASGQSQASTSLFVTMLTPTFPQDFELASFPPCEWTSNNAGISRLATASGFGIGTAAARWNFFNTSAGAQMELVTHTFTPTTGAEALNYDWAYQAYTGGEIDSLEILYSDDAGTNWYSLAIIEGGATGPLNTAGTSSSAFVPTSAQWASNSLSLPANTNKIMFRGKSDFGNNLWIDNITLGAAPTCTAPSGIAASNVTGTSADINWTCSGCTGTFILEYGPAGFTVGTGTLVNPATAPVSLSLLTPGSAYDVYLMQDCGGSQSANVGPYSFSTNVCGTETIIGCGDTATAVIAAGNGSWNITTCGFATPGREKLYSFTATTSGVHQLVVTSATGGYIDYFFKDATLGCDNLNWTCIDDNNAPGTDAFTLVAGTTYYLLLDPEGTAGMTHSFYVQCPVAPSCLTNPTSPANGGNACLASNPITLSWPSAPGATSYDVYFDAGISATTLVSPAQAGTTYAAGTLAAGSYAWRVIPKNAVGDAVGCGDWTFSMSGVPSPGDSLQDPIIVASLPASINGNNLPCFQNNYSGATNRASADVFYQFTTGPCADSVFINTCTSSFDTYIHLLDATGVELEFDDDDCSSPNGAGSLILRDIDPNTTYYVVVEGFNAADAGTFTLEINQIDIPQITYYADTDNDTYGDLNNTTTVCSYSAPSGYVTNTADCDDLNSAVNPAATEVCNGIDDDCDGSVDEGVIPGAGSISGNPIDLCWPIAPGIGSYTISAVPNATTYTWTVPAGMFITGGQGTATITIQWNASAVNTGIIGNVTCIASNPCGAGPVNTLGVAITAVKPVTPGSISGPTKLCPGDNAVYSIATVARASFYQWTFPTGVTPVGSASGNIVNVTVDGSYAGGTVTAAAGNACGVGGVRTRAVSLNLPLTPGAISGQATGVCGNLGELYSIGSVSNALSYSWSVGAGASIPGSTTGLSVSVDFSNALASTVLSVSSVNGCGTSAARNLTITGAPGLPSVVTGPTTVCTGATDHYSVNTVVGATSYTWTAPGTIVTGQGTKEVDITWGSSPATSQQITVRASNDCGNGPLRTLGGVNINFCARISSTLQADLEAYPNPATDVVTVRFNTKADYSLSIIDVTGRTVSTQSNTANGNTTASVDVSQLTSGVYMVVLQTSNGTEQVRLVVE